MSIGFGAAFCSVAVLAQAPRRSGTQNIAARTPIGHRLGVRIGWKSPRPALSTLPAARAASSEAVREIAMAAHGVLAAGGKARGGGDADPSATTSNAACGRNDPVPSGFGRRGVVCYVAAPRRCPASPRRGALHTAPRRPERGRCYSSDRLLGRARRRNEGASG